MKKAGVVPPVPTKHNGWQSARMCFGSIFAPVRLALAGVPRAASPVPTHHSHTYLQRVVSSPITYGHSMFQKVTQAEVRGQLISTLLLFVQPHSWCSGVKLHPWTLLEWDSCSGPQWEMNNCCKERKITGCAVAAAGSIHCQCYQLQLVYVSKVKDTVNFKLKFLRIKKVWTWIIHFSFRR